MFSGRCFRVCAVVFNFRDLKKVSALGQVGIANLRGVRERFETTYQKVGAISSDNVQLLEDFSNFVESPLDDFTIRKVGTVSKKALTGSVKASAKASEAFSLKPMMVPVPLAVNNNLLESLGGNIVNVVEVIDDEGGEKALAQADDSESLFHSGSRQIVNFVEVVKTETESEKTGKSVSGSIIPEQAGAKEAEEVVVGRIKELLALVVDATDAE